MHRPRAWEAVGLPRPLGAVRLLDAVGEHEHDGEGGAEDERRRRVEQEDDPPRVKQQRDRERPAEEQHLSAHELDQVPAPRSRKAAPTDPTPRHILEIVDEVPLGEQEPIQRPQVELLEMVQAVARLPR